MSAPKKHTPKPATTSKRRRRVMQLTLNDAVADWLEAEAARRMLPVGIYARTIIAAEYERVRNPELPLLATTTLTAAADAIEREEHNR